MPSYPGGYGSRVAASAGPPRARGNNLGFRPSNGANLNLPRARVSSLVYHPTQVRLDRGSQNQQLKRGLGEGLREDRLSPKYNSVMTRDNYLLVLL